MNIDSKWKNPTWFDNAIKKNDDLILIGPDKPITFYQNINHIMDYFASLNTPQIIFKLGYNEALRNANQWTKELAKRKGDLGGIELISKLSDGFTLVKLLTKAACEHEGNIMGHCVASYGEKVEFGKTSVYSIRDNKDESHVSIEIKNNTVTQIKRKQNQFPVEKYHKYILEVFSKILKNVDVNLSEYGFVKDVKGVWYRIEDMPEGIKIKGDLDIQGTNMKSLPGIECDKIYAYGSKLESISKDLKCKDLSIRFTNVKILLEIECDEIYAYNSKLESISKDLKCKTLDIGNTPLSKR